MMVSVQARTKVLIIRHDLGIRGAATRLIRI